MHFHRDLLASLRHVRQARARPAPSDVFSGTPPLAFTFGLGGLVLFPLRFGASTAPVAKPGDMLDAIRERGITTLFTAPTAYRAMLAQDVPDSLHTCVSAGEPLPAGGVGRVVREDRHPDRRRDRLDRDAAHLHRLAGRARRGRARAGGRCPGYEARIVDEDMRTLPPGAVGKLAVRGPTGCRYLDDPRQSAYVRDGWNLTGDAFSMDADGYFWFQARTDDMIISSGYNISGFEVEAALLEHPLVAECAVVAAPDVERGHVVKAYVVASETGRGAGAAGPRQGADRALQVPAPDRVRRRAAAHADGQGPAQRAAGAVGSEAPAAAGLAASRAGTPTACSPRAGSCSSAARSAGTRAASFAADLAGQVRQTLLNIVAVLAEADARPEHVARLTWYITDREDYLAQQKEIGAAYRDVMGRHFPAMAVVQVVALVEAEAMVEIEATAVLPAP